MKRALCGLLLAEAFLAGGCVVAPDYLEQERRREAEPFVMIEETGSRIKRRVPLSELASATWSGAGASPVKTIGGEALRSKSTLPDVFAGP